jgi:hypothetical protein
MAPEHNSRPLTVSHHDMPVVQLTLASLQSVFLCLPFDADDRDARIIIDRLVSVEWDSKYKRKLPAVDAGGGEKLRVVPLLVLHQPLTRTNSLTAIQWHRGARLGRPGG